MLDYRPEDVVVEYAPMELDGQETYRVEIYYKDRPNFRMFCTYQPGSCVEPIHGADISSGEDEILHLVEARLFELMRERPETIEAHRLVEELRRASVEARS